MNTLEVVLVILAGFLSGYLLVPVVVGSFWLGGLLGEAMEGAARDQLPLTKAFCRFAALVFCVSLWAGLSHEVHVYLMSLPSVSGSKLFVWAFIVGLLSFPVFPAIERALRKSAKREESK